MLKIENEVKQGPNIMSDPKLITKVTSGFIKTKLDFKSGRHSAVPLESENKPIISKQSGRCDYANELIVNEQIYNFKALKGKKQIMSSVPTGALSYVRYKRCLPNNYKDKAQIIIRKDALAMNMKLIEQNQQYKIKKNTKSEENTIQR